MPEEPIRLDEVWTFCEVRLADDEKRARRGYYADTHWDLFSTTARLHAWRAWRAYFPREQWDAKANDAVAEAARDGIRERITAHEDGRSRRALADIAFKRELLAEHEPTLQAAVRGAELTPMLVCRIDGDTCPFTQGLAAVYCDHEDYKESWRA
ncbi:DUF6221 family protein [Streptomyces sp. NPDC002812]|uniref:DUF6221 family protein n=1 Tax=Streptomyces sp. NPDC002812 TaxID=3154434 RepID=UPI003327581E